LAAVDSVLQSLTRGLAPPMRGFGTPRRKRKRSGDRQYCGGSFDARHGECL